MNEQGVERRDLSVRKSPLTIGLLASVGGTLDAFFLEIAEVWRARGVKVVGAAGTTANLFRPFALMDGVTRAPSIGAPRAIKSLKRWVSSSRIDVVLTNTATASMLSRIAGVPVPVVYFCHGLHWDSPRPSNLAYRMVERALLERTNGVICINSADEEWFKLSGTGVPRLRLLHGVGLDLDRFAHRSRGCWSGKEETLRLVWCGEFSGRKNPADAVAAAATLARRGISVSLKMIGEGPLRGNLDIPCYSGLSVELVGRADPVPFFDDAHVLVQTSRWEGLPRVGLEAAAMGLPNAGYDVKGVQDIPGISVTKFGDVEALANVVTDVAAKESEGYCRRELLSYSHSANSILEFICDIADGNLARGYAVQE